MPNARIAVITQAVKLADEVAGLNRTSYVAELLTKSGYEVDLITSTFQHWEKQRRNIVDAKYHELPYNVIFLEEPGYQKNISLARIHSQNIFSTNLREYLSRFGHAYDLIWCQIPPNNIAAQAGLFAREQGIPFVVDINDLWPEAMKMVVDLPLVSDHLLASFTQDAETAYACASAAVGTSDEYAGRCHQNIPHLTVYVGGDIACFDAGVAQHSPAIRKGSDELWVTYAGSLAKSYDIATLIRACSLAAPLVSETSGKRLSLRILGDGPKRTELEELAATSAAPVEFCGYLDYPVMAAHLVASDILVNSLIKNAPQSIVSKIGDYLCAGRPIINTGESCEFRDKCIADGFGINVEPENLAELTGAILALANDEEAREAMGARGRAIAEAQFDRPVSYKPIVELISSLI